MSEPTSLPGARDDPLVIADASHYLRRFHFDHPGAARDTGDVDGARELLDRFGVLREASAPVRTGLPAGL